jgi:hypothetical protein
MVDLILIDQQTYHDQIAPKIQQLKIQMNLRLEIWQKLSLAKKKAWVTSNKDPIMTLAFQTGQYLKDNFPELLEDYNG